MPGKSTPVRVSQSEVRQNTGPGHTVHTYPELVTKVASLGFYHRGSMLFFRGQTREFTTERDNLSIYPAIFRDDKGSPRLKKDVLVDRFSQLSDAAHELITDCGCGGRISSAEFKQLKRHRELVWAILQHYEIAETPYLDMSASLRVAASFATMDTRKGTVYVFAMPYPTHSISFAVDQDITMIHLQAACPPRAKRPHFQEGYLAGSYYISPDEPHPPIPVQEIRGSIQVLLHDITPRFNDAPGSRLG